MIATLNGTVQEKLDQITVIAVGGVGYGVITTAREQDRLTIGDELKVYIYENIKEDNYTLYGFTKLDDKKLFEQLLSVKNVGPKVAMSILDVAPSSEVRAAIAGGDVARLQSAKGVGKRAAEQIVVELRDKVGLLASGTAEDIVSRSGLDMNDEAVQALVALGYSEVDATLALKHVDTSLAAEERVKQALRGRS